MKGVHRTVDACLGLTPQEALYPLHRVCACVCVLLCCVLSLLGRDNAGSFDAKEAIGSVSVLKERA